MFRLITIEREYGCGAAAIAESLALHLGWKLWDHLLTEEIARLAHVAISSVSRSDERGSALGDQVFDADRRVKMMEQIAPRIAREGNAVVVGRAAPYFLREQSDAFHVFLYAPRAEKVHRILQEGCPRSAAEELVDTGDRERVTFVKHYFDADWPTRSLYHVMIN